MAAPKRVSFRDALRGKGMTLAKMISIEGNSHLLLALESNEVINRSHVQTIEKQPNDPAKVSKLVEILTGRPDKLFQAFIDSLCDKDVDLEHVVEALWPEWIPNKGNVADSPKIATPVEPSRPQQQPPANLETHKQEQHSQPSDSPSEKVVITDVKVMKCGEKFFKENSRRGVYKISRGESPKKTAFIINLFDHPTHPRHGTNTDCDNLRSLFGHHGLGFDCRTFDDRDDLTEEGFRRVLNKIADSVTLAQSQCLVLFVLSHGDSAGGEEWIECTDGGHFMKNDVIDRFTDEKCPALKDKPRLIFLASCRGRANLNKTDAVTVPDHFFVGLPCKEGYTAVRHEKFGSRYIRAIVDIFMNKAHDTELEALMNEVQPRLDEMQKDDGLHQEAVYENNLQNNFYFFP